MGARLTSGNEAQQHCASNQHVLSTIPCMGRDCFEKPLICRNRGCGQPSKVHPDIMLCKLCKINEINQDPLTAAQMKESDLKVNLQLTSTLSYDPNKEKHDFVKESLVAMVEDSNNPS